jgi:hypothetical protein
VRIDLRRARSHRRKMEVEDVYFNKFEVIRDVLPVMPKEIVSILNIVGNTVLHKNMEGKKPVPHDVHLRRRKKNLEMDQVWCTKCNAFRPEQNFERFKSEKTRHSRKRKLGAVFDNWDDFESRLLTWNHLV